MFTYWKIKHVCENETYYTFERQTVFQTRPFNAVEITEEQYLKK